MNEADRKSRAIAPIDPIKTAPDKPLVDTAHMMEPHAKAAVPTATSETPEYESTVNSLRRSPIGQLKAIALRNEVTIPDGALTPDPAVPAEMTAHNDFIVSLAEAEVQANQYTKFEQV